jgi:hypothetical protein
MSFDVDNGLSKVLFRLECIIIERSQLCVISLGSLLDRGVAISIFPEFEGLEIVRRESYKALDE